jgi:glycine/D-amino acid oxidase-like deaminating enzyme
MGAGNCDYDAIVVGGGIVGCACAYYLSHSFKRVLVVEPGPVGGGSTAAGMGHIVVMDDSPAQFALTHMSQQLWSGLFPQMSPGCEVRPTGTVWVASDAEEFSHVEDKQRFYAEHGVEAEVLDAKSLHQAEPNLHASMVGGLRVPGDSVIYPMTAAGWLLDEAKKNGAELRQGKCVARLDGRSVELGDGTVLEADFVVNAAGGHAPELTPGLPIEPRKGHLVITDRYPGFVHHQLIELGYLKSAHEMSHESVAFNAQPRATGQVLLGSSRQFVGWDSKIDRRLVSKMIDRAALYIPAIRDLHCIRIWIGFRATTPDSLPLIGAMPEDPTLLIAAGHEGLGISTSLATGRLIADIATGAQSSIDPTPYAPVRKAHG